MGGPALGAKEKKKDKERSQMGGLAGVDRRRMDRIAVITARVERWSSGFWGPMPARICSSGGLGYQISPGRRCPAAVMQHGNRVVLMRLSTMLSMMLRMSSTMFLDGAGEGRLIAGWKARREAVQGKEDASPCKRKKGKSGRITSLQGWRAMINARPRLASALRRCGRFDGTGGGESRSTGEAALEV